MIKSYNNQIICEPYGGSKGLKSKITSGVAVVQQKTGVIGLRVLRDAYLFDNGVNPQINKGDIVYLREDVLHVNQNYSQPLECDSISEKFVLINFAHVAFVKGK